MSEIYSSLDEARQELIHRSADEALRQRIESALGGHFMQNFKESPRSVVFRQLCSPDNGFLFFYQCSRYIGAHPLVIEYQDDIFVHFNEEKKGLGRLRVRTESDDPAIVDIMDFHANEKKPLRDAVLKDGQRLADFHHALFKILGYNNDVTLHDNSAWFKEIGKAKEYYYFFLLHFLAHGVLFETFIEDEDDAEGDFTREIIQPALQRIYEEYGLRPLIVRMYPDNQSDLEDFYWWSYPPAVNAYLLQYAEDQGLSKKTVKI